MIKAIAFDFDGVIVDSVPVKDCSFQLLFEEYGPTVVKKAMDYWFSSRGVKRKQRIQQAYADILQIDLNNIELEKKNTIFSESAVEGVKHSELISGALDFLQINQNINKYIVSAAPDIELLEILKCKRLDHYFKKIFGAKNSKYKCLQSILTLENIHKNELLFIGDALNDFLSAQKADIHFLGIVKKKQLNPFPPKTKTTHNLLDLNDILKSINCDYQNQ
jgi:HAD superfamily hydrolase (TIGR01549 family)